MKNKLVALAFAIALLGANSVQAQTPCEDIQNGWDAAKAATLADFEACKEEADDWWDDENYELQSELWEMYDHFVWLGNTTPYTTARLGTQANYSYAYIEWEVWMDYITAEWEAWYCDCKQAYQDQMLAHWIYYDSYAQVHDCNWDDSYTLHPSTWPVNCN